MCSQLLRHAPTLASEDAHERERDVLNWADFPVEHWERTRARVDRTRNKGKKLYFFSTRALSRNIQRKKISSPINVPAGVL